MSGAADAEADGSEDRERTSPRPATVTEEARGSTSDDDRRREGKAVSGEASVPDVRQPQPYPQGAPPRPYHPPQAYPAPAAGGDHHDDQPVGVPRGDLYPVPRTRRARLRIAKVDPWSVMKVGFLLSIALGVCTVVAVGVLWTVMDAMGVFSTVGGTISEATASDENSGFDLQGFLSLSRVLTFTGIVALIDVILATALATLGAFIYNLSAGFVGGVEVTLAEDE